MRAHRERPFSKPLAFCAALAATTPGAVAASFDCARAASTVERTICADPALSSLDDRLGAVYARRKAGDASVAAAQRAWLRDVRDRCGGAECLRAAYAARLAALAPAPADGAACALTASALVGAWRNVNPAGGEFEELRFGPAGESPNFTSWVRHAPYVTGTWILRDCKVHVAGTGEGTDFDFAVIATGDGRLRLQDLADADDVLILARAAK